MYRGGRKKTENRKDTEIEGKRRTITRTRIEETQESVRMWMEGRERERDKRKRRTSEIKWEMKVI